LNTSRNGEDQWFKTDQRPNCALDWEEETPVGKKTEEKYDKEYLQQTKEQQIVTP
jgi:hypothetical protein